MRFFGTLGPKCHTKEDLLALFEAGMTGMRLNLSHGDLKDGKEWIEALEAAANSFEYKNYELLVDLNGPELRIGKINQRLQDGELFVIGKGGLEVPRQVFDVLKIGHYVLLDDGKIRLKCKEVYENSAVLEVIRGGQLSSHKSLAIENVTVHLPTLSSTDLENIKEMKNYPVTGVMLPFVRNKDDLLVLRNTLDDAGLTHIRIYAKIENMQGVIHLPEFIEACDEVVIARGDLGNAMSLYELPAVQKKLAEICKKYHKPFMVVTQMLNSMIENPVPTRAEVSDIFNAVLDGASSLMVTGETAIGKYPSLVMDYLVKTANEGVKWLQQ